MRLKLFVQLIQAQQAKINLTGNARFYASPDKKRWSRNCICQQILENYLPSQFYFIFFFKTSVSGYGKELAAKTRIYG